MTNKNQKLTTKNQKYFGPLATLISIVLSPLFLLPALLLMMASQGYLKSSDQFYTFFKILGLGYIAGLATWVIFKKTRQISTWGIDDRVERHRFNLIIFIILTILIYLFYRTGLTIMVRYLLLLMSGFLLFAFVTLFWKISAHSASVTLFALTAMYYYGSRAWWTLIFIPLVSWARVYHKNHTIAQVTGGIMLSIFMFLIGYYLKLI